MRISLDLAPEGLDGGHHAGQGVLLTQHRPKAALHRQKGTPRENDGRCPVPLKSVEVEDVENPLP